MHSGCSHYCSMPYSYLLFKSSVDNQLCSNSDLYSELTSWNWMPVYHYKQLHEHLGRFELERRDHKRSRHHLVWRPGPIKPVYLCDVEYRPIMLTHALWRSPTYPYLGGCCLSIQFWFQLHMESGASGCHPPDHHSRPDHEHGHCLRSIHSHLRLRISFSTLIYCRVKRRSERYLFCCKNWNRHRPFSWSRDWRNYC